MRGGVYQSQKQVRCRASGYRSSLLELGVVQRLVLEIEIESSVVYHQHRNQSFQSQVRLSSRGHGHERVRVREESKAEGVLKRD